MSAERNEEKGEARPMVEWVVGAVSAVLVVCLVLYLGRQALFGESRPAELRASIEEVSRRGDTTTLTVAVRNGGDKAASAVTVLALGPGASAMRQIELDYVAAHAVRRGAFVFPGAVNPDDIRVEIGGYAEP